MDKMLEKAGAKQQAIHFMRGIMDEFTHLANYSTPVEGCSIVVVTASDDAYVPREGSTDLSSLWPQSEIRYIPTGHVGAYVLHHKMFRWECCVVWMFLWFHQRFFLCVQESSEGCLWQACCQTSLQQLNHCLNRFSCFMYNNTWKDRDIFKSDSFITAHWKETA